jgi:hypothetical protein
MHLMHDVTAYRKLRLVQTLRSMVTHGAVVVTSAKKAYPSIRHSPVKAHQDHTNVVRLQQQLTTHKQ